MKKIGLIGGMSWESTQVYYQHINKIVREIKGGYHSAICNIESVDFFEIEMLQRKNDWNKLNHLMANSAKNLENAGADCIVLCTNTMHLCNQSIKESVNIPFLHIADAVGENIKKTGLKKVLLLGTNFTMNSNLYSKILSEKFSIEVMTPKNSEKNTVHQIIYDELVFGKFKKSSKIEFIQIINKAIHQGAEGVILGCTEIPILINQKDLNIPVFDTTYLHAKKAVEFSII